MATHIQASALPATFPESEVFNLYASIHTVREVGGDFYDFFMIDENHLCFLIADATDEGAPAALYMMTSGASLIALALMTFFINARHIFMASALWSVFAKWAGAACTWS